MFAPVSRVTLSLPVLMDTSLLLPGRPALQSAVLLQLPVPPSQLSGDEGALNGPPVAPNHMCPGWATLVDLERCGPTPDAWVLPMAQRMEIVRTSGRCLVNMALLPLTRDRPVGNGRSCERAQAGLCGRWNSSPQTRAGQSKKEAGVMQVTANGELK